MNSNYLETAQKALSILGTLGTCVLCLSIVRNRHHRKPNDVTLFGLAISCLLLSGSTLILPFQQVFVSCLNAQCLAMCWVGVKNVCLLKSRATMLGFTSKVAWLGNICNWVLVLIFFLTISKELETVWIFLVISLTTLWIVLSSIFVLVKTRQFLLPRLPTSQQVERSLQTRSLIFVAVFLVGWVPAFAGFKLLWLLEETTRVHSLLVVLAYGWHNESLPRCCARYRICCQNKYTLRTTKSNHITVTVKRIEFKQTKQLVKQPSPEDATPCPITPHATSNPTEPIPEEDFEASDLVIVQPCPTIEEVGSNGLPIVPPSPTLLEAKSGGHSPITATPHNVRIQMFPVGPNGPTGNRVAPPTPKLGPAPPPPSTSSFEKPWTLSQGSRAGLPNGTSS